MGGMLDGTGWLAELRDQPVGSITLEQALELAAKTLFKQKGIKNKLSRAVSDLAERAGQQATYGFTPPADLEKLCDQAVARGKATLAQAAILQIFKGDIRAEKDATVAQLVVQTEAIHGDEVDTSLVFPCVVAVFAGVTTRPGK